MIAEPRPSAGLCLLREGQDGGEVLMVRRGHGAPFMGGAWVFPGGVVDSHDRSAAALAALDGAPAGDAPWLAAGVRELVEETGIWLSGAPVVLSADRRPAGADVWRLAADLGRFAVGGLALFSIWVTPTMVPVRFAARFYVGILDLDGAGIADGREIDAVAWMTPAEALRRAADGSLLLPFPTRRTLEHFGRLASAAEVLEHARSRTEIEPIQPRLRLVGDTLEALLPGDPGYTDVGDLPPDPDALARIARVVSAGGEPIPEMIPRRSS